MNWDLRWNPRAFRFLDKLPKNVALRVIDKLEQVRANPFHYLEHFEGDKSLYKLRIGDYRLLVDVDFSKKTLTIRVFDHRSKVYER
jgi:mRNA interferase RelE/StbE